MLLARLLPIRGTLTAGQWAPSGRIELSRIPLPLSATRTYVRRNPGASREGHPTGLALEVRDEAAGELPVHEETHPFQQRLLQLL